MTRDEDEARPIERVFAELRLTQLEDAVEALARWRIGEYRAKLGPGVLYVLPAALQRFDD